MNCVFGSMEKPSKMKTSRVKIWVRTIIFAFFTIIFTLALYQDISSNCFPLWPIPIIFLLGAIFGLWLSRFIPMKVHHEYGLITFSFDFIYMILIVLLVVVKIIASWISGWGILVDIIMVFILGMMFGRIGGMGIRVRKLKREHGLR